MSMPSEDLRRRLPRSLTVSLKTCVIGAILVWVGGCGTDASRAGDLTDLDALPLIHAEEQLRIGSLDDPDRGFSRVSEYAEVTGDTIWLAELSVPEIRTYAPDGQLVRRIGSRGSGPGELRSITRWGLQGDTAWIYDASLRRVTLFKKDGVVLNSTPAGGILFDVPPYVVTIVPIELRGDGDFNGEMISYSWPSLGFSTPMSQLPLRTADIPMIVFDPAGLPRDTVGFFSLTMGGPFPGGIQPVMVGNYEVGVSSPLPRPRLAFSLGVDTIVVTQPEPEDPSGASITVHRIDANGDTVFARSLQYLPQIVPTAFSDSVIAAKVEFASRSGEDLQALERAARSTTIIPSHFPPISGIRVAADSSIWLLRTEPGSSRTWVVLGRDGTAKGRMITSSGAVLLWSDGRTGVFRESDEFDVPWVVRYRLEQGD